MRAAWRLRAAQMAATALFLAHVPAAREGGPLAWGVPFALMILMIVNSIRFTRFASWFVFAASFFCFLVVLSALTLRWRLEPGFDSTPFYITIGMYVAFIYVSLAQLKILGGGASDGVAAGSSKGGTT